MPDDKVVVVHVDPKAYGVGMGLGCLIRFWKQILTVILVIAACAITYYLLGQGYDHLYKNFNFGSFGKCPPSSGCIKELKGQNYLQDIIFSPDGKLMASKDLSSVRIWDVTADYKPLASLEGATLIAFSPDSNSLISTSGHTLKVWEARSGQLILSIDAGENITSLALSNDGRLVAVGGTNHLFTVWDLSSGNLINDLSEQINNPNYDYASFLAFSSDNILVMVNNWVILLFNPTTGELLGQLDPNQGLYEGTSLSINQISFSSDGRFLALGSILAISGGYSAGGMVQIWDFPQRQLVKQVYDPERIPNIWNFSFANNDQWLVWTDSKFTATIYDIESGAIIQSVTPRTETTVKAVAITPDNQALVTGDEEIRFWKITAKSQNASSSVGIPPNSPAGATKGETQSPTIVKVQPDNAFDCSLPLKLYWSDIWEDNYSTTDALSDTAPVPSDYRFIRVEGSIFPTQAPGTVPLKVYYSESRGDYFLTATRRGEMDATLAGYELIGTAGYIYPDQQPGTVPLKLYWGAAREDNFSTPTSIGENDALAVGYEYVRVEGYVCPVSSNGN